MEITLTPVQKIEIGINNPRGYSAYQIAVNHGFVGTQEEWLASLKGKDGVIPQDKIDQIDINTNDISDLKTFDERIANINKSLQRQVNILKASTEGIAWVGEIDNSESYTKNIPQGAKGFELKSIGGKCIVVNQVVNPNKISETSTHNGITYRKNTDGSYTLNGTATGNSIKDVLSVAGYGIIANHKYMMVCLTTNNDISIGDSYSGYYSNQYRVSTFTNKNHALTIMVADGTVLNDVKVYPMSFDLTVMGVADYSNEDAFKYIKQILNSDNYHPYTEPTIKTICCDSVEVKGKNSAKSIYNNTVVTPYLNALFIDGDLKSNTTYTISFKGDVGNKIYSNEYLFIAPYPRYVCDGNRQFVTVTTKDNVGKNVAGQYYNGRGWIVFKNGENNSVLPNFSDVMVEETSENTSYSPYHEPQQLPIPQAIQQLDGYGWSAGDVYNEVDYVNKQYIKRVEKVDLGSLLPSQWSMVAKYGFYTSAFSNLVKKVKSNKQANIICSVRTSATWDNMYNVGVNGDKIAVQNQGYIGISSPLTIKDEFISSMQGVYAYIELAEPKEIPIADKLADFDNTVLCEGNGSVTFKNTLGDDYKVPIPNEIEYYVKVVDAL